MTAHNTNDAGDDYDHAEKTTPTKAQVKELDSVLEMQTDYYQNLATVQRFLEMTKAPTLDQLFLYFAAIGFDIQLKTLRRPRKEYNLGGLQPLFDVTYAADVWAKDIAITATGAKNEIVENNRHFGFDCGDTPSIAAVNACARAVIKFKHEKEWFKK